MFDLSQRSESVPTEWGAMHAVTDWVTFYNCETLHLTPCYRSRMKFEQGWIAAKQQHGKSA